MSGNIPGAGERPGGHGVLCGQYSFSPSYADPFAKPHPVVDRVGGDALTIAHSNAHSNPHDRGTTAAAYRHPGTANQHRTTTAAAATTAHENAATAAHRHATTATAAHRYTTATAAYRYTTATAAYRHATTTHTDIAQANLNSRLITSAPLTRTGVYCLSDSPGRHEIGIE